MTKGDTVFAADGARIGRLYDVDADWLTVCGDGHTFRLPRAELAFERDHRLFLSATSRSAVRSSRIDLSHESRLFGWWDRSVMGESPDKLGGRLED